MDLGWRSYSRKRTERSEIRAGHKSTVGLKVEMYPSLEECQNSEDLKIHLR
jgi:hypothetical protein